MENRKLIGMTDFVLEQYKIWAKDNKDSHCTSKYVAKTNNYAKFLKQPLQKWMFVPFDEEGNVLEKQVKPYWNISYNNEIGSMELYKYRLLDYQNYKKALENVLFEGFDIEQHESDSFSIRCENNILNVMWNFSDQRGWFPARGISTIEDLVKYNLTLTATALKQIEG